MQEILSHYGIQENNSANSVGEGLFGTEKNSIESKSPTDGKSIGWVGFTSESEYHSVVEQAQKGFEEWKNWTAPARGEVIRQLGEELRKEKEALGKLVSYEMGKSYQEGLGEVQEMIDICDFAVGLSRQLYGLTMHSERPQHRMYEQWHPLGVVGIISAFNFPVAVWSWNTALAWACGNACIWKPSEKTPLTSIACQVITERVFQKNGVPKGVSSLIQGGRNVGEWLSHDGRIQLVSATGSTRMGKEVGAAVGARLGKSILELGGNNAIIVSEHADLDASLLGMVFGAVGTCGQRCTSTRRLIIHESIYDKVVSSIQAAYQQIKIGDPLDTAHHVGPLIDQDAVQNYLNAINKAKSEGATMLVEGGVLEGKGYESGCYVKPCVIEANSSMSVVKEETFAPILYVMKYSTLEEGLAQQNGVNQGLSSAIMTLNMREMEQFLSVNGSDCGIANVNIGTSGAEIGGAFGGEKETGGGRESGSDAWKGYMRRQTTTINYGTELPLAQGIEFKL